MKFENPTRVQLPPPSVFAREIIRQAYQGLGNMITPKQIGCYNAGKYAIEFSTGEWAGVDVFAVAVVDIGTLRIATKMGKAFSDWDEGALWVRALMNQADAVAAVVA